MMTSVMPEIIERFAQEHPRTNVQVVLESTPTVQFQQLRERNIDLLIARTSQLSPADDLTTEILFEERFVAVAGARSKWGRQRRVRLHDLVDQRWVLLPYESVPGLLIVQIFRASKLDPPRASIATLSVQLTVTLIASAQFVGLLPGSVARLNTRRAELKILRLELPGPRIAAGIVSVKNRTLSPTAHNFIECTREVAKSIG